MDKQTKVKIKSMVLNLREKFEEEIGNRLNYFGIYANKTWKHLNALTYLNKEERENRKKVSVFIKRVEGISQEEAVKEFVKEASYTWINRLIGLKCMETRGLLNDEIITTRPEYGNRSKRHRDFREKHPDLASRPDDGFIPCLFEVFSEITEEIKILFDPESEYTLVVPRYPFLKKIIETINIELEYDTYREDELLGWVYQYFQTKEKDRIFEEVRTKKKKISGSDIIPVTSLYTEKYMVKFLVENSLGALWQERYPDSTLKEKWEYFVEDPNNTTREQRPVKEITFLDPACGSGHFLLYAFDVFYDMYKEERKRNPEWAVPEDEIPQYILKYNLHGIDIDLRSIQLSALGLYMKAKQKNPDIEIKQMNLVAANAVMMNSEILQDFLEEFEGDPMAQEIIKTLWEGLENIRELGSLLKIEEQIDAAIERGRGQLRLRDMSSAQEEKFSWNTWKQELLDALRRYYEKITGEEGDISKQLFAREAEKGVNFIDLMSQKYDVVATNPPYLHKRNMNTRLKKIIKSHYYGSDLDLYSAFIDRNLQLIGSKNFVAMITQQSFMFTKKYQKLREKLIEKYFIRILVHLGPHAFKDISGEKVNTTMFILSSNEYKNGIYFRLTDKIDKSLELISSIDSDISSHKYVIPYMAFKTIEGYPFIYWIGDHIRDLFVNLDNLNKHSEIKQGLATGNNDKFLRFFWERNTLCIDKNWRPYAKGGKFDKWYTNIDLIINWNSNAIDEYKKTQFAQIYVSRNANKYLCQDCLTYTLIGGKSISVRFLEKGSVTDVSGSSIFSTKYSLDYLIGFLNSKLISYILSFLNPTLSFQVGDLKKVPFLEPDNEKIISSLAKECVNIKKSFLQFVINDHEFKQPAIFGGKNILEGGNLRE